MALTTIPSELSSVSGIADSSDATAITISSSENVGIGTNAPTSPLHISSATNRTLLLDYTAGSGGYSWMSFKQSGTEKFRIFGSYADGYLSFYNETQSAHQITLASGGNVGIGASSPTAPLHVDGAQAYASSATNLSTTVSKAAFRMQGSSDSSTSLFMGALTNDAQMYIQSSNGAGSAADDIILNPFGGSVGIGIGNASPSSNLHVKGTGETQIFIDAAASNNPGIRLLENGTNKWTIGNDQSNDSLFFYDFGASATRVVINNGGNVGLGTSSPTSPNSVNKFLHIHNADHSSLVMSDDQNTWEIVSNNNLTIRDGTDTRLTVDTSGNVGINHTSPEHHLHVTEPGSTNEDGIVKIGGSAAGLGLELKYDQAGSTTTEIVANPTYTNTASLMRLCVDRDANANQLCLLGSGNIGIGTDAPGSSKLYVTSNTDAIFTAYFLNDHSGGYGVAVRSDSSSMMYFYDGGTFKGRIYHNGTTMLYADQSDYRLKENVQTMTGSIDRIKKLNPVTFDWKADGKSSEGFLAHEVQDVVPTAVAGEKDAEITEHGEGIQIMDYGKVTPVLVGALQEALAKIEALEAKVKALEEA